MTTTKAKSTYPVSTYRDDQGREFHYVFINRSKNKMVIHFTAFFGDWGDQKQFKTNYQGYFHRLRMLSSVEDYNLLFLCDQFGVTQNGTYYTGEKGDFFVERAMEKIIEKCLKESEVSADQVITIGPSMGATGALKFGLKFNVKGIIAISPHIDLDTCARMQGRELHVSYILADGKPYTEENKVYTRQIENLIKTWPKDKKLPRLFIHSCSDDHGVHEEQVVPVVNYWKERSSFCELDERPVGGHGSDYATKAVILNVIDNMFQNKASSIKQYQKAWKYKPDAEREVIFYIKKYLRPVKRFLMPYLKPVMNQIIKNKNTK